MNADAPLEKGTVTAPRNAGVWGAIIATIFVVLGFALVVLPSQPNSGVAGQDGAAPTVEATPEMVASTERLLVEGQDYTATTPATDVTSGYTQQLTIASGTTLRRYISFDTLVGDWQSELVITKIMVNSTVSGTNYPFQSYWAITKDGATSGSNYRECCYGCTGAGARQFTIDIADNTANTFNDLATWAGNAVKVWLNGGTVTNLNQYTFQVYGYYTGADPFASTPTTTAAPTTTATPTTTAATSTTPTTSTTSADAPYSGNWYSDPGPSISPTHNISQVKQAQTAYQVTEQFALGCSTGSSIRSIKYTYYDNDPNVGISANGDYWGIKIGSILSPTQAGLYDAVAGTAKVNFLQPGLDKLNSAAPGTVVETKLTAVIAALGADGDGQIVNKGSLTGMTGLPNSSDEDVPFETPETQVETYIAKLQVNKVNQDGAVLDGATFQLYQSDTCTTDVLKALNPLRLNGVDSWTTTGGTFTIDGLHVTDVVDNAPDTQEGYCLVETEAPAGYELLTDPIALTFTKEEMSTTGTFVPLKSQEVTNVPSTKVFLPSTGGMGVGLIIAAGAAIIGAGAYAARRNSAA